MLRSYHLMDYDWTPLSQNPCWWCSVLLGHHFLNKVRFIFRSIAKRNRKRVAYRRFEWWSSKSWKDDPTQTGYCTYESGLYATICWGLSQIHWFGFLKFKFLLTQASVVCVPTDGAGQVPSSTTHQEPRSRNTWAAVCVPGVVRFFPATRAGPGYMPGPFQPPAQNLGAPCADWAGPHLNPGKGRFFHRKFRFFWYIAWQLPRSFLGVL